MLEVVLQNRTVKTLLSLTRSSWEYGTKTLRKVINKMKGAAQIVSMHFETVKTNFMMNCRCLNVFLLYIFSL